MEIPKKYANTPNLWRLACELSKFKNPYKACDMLLALADAGVFQKERKEGDVA